MLHVGFLFVKLNSPWNFLREIGCMLGFLRETWCLLIFVHETCCMLVITSRNLMHLDLNLVYFYFFFMKLVACIFFSLLNLYVVFLLMKLVLFFFCKRLNVFWFILSRNVIYHDIFLCKTCCMLVLSSFSMMHVDFVHEPCSMWINSSRYLMYLDLFLRKTCSIFIFASLKLLLIDFSLRETRIRFFSSWKWFCSWNYLRAVFFVKLSLSCYFSSWILVYSELFFVKLNFSWYFSSWSLLYVYFVFFSLLEICTLFSSRRETPFFHGICCVLIFVPET